MRHDFPNATTGTAPPRCPVVVCPDGPVGTAVAAAAGVRVGDGNGRRPVAPPGPPPTKPRSTEGPSNEGAAPMSDQNIPSDTPIHDGVEADTQAVDAEVTDDNAEEPGEAPAEEATADEAE